ncbi:MAG: hypothetical protein IKN91_01415 [Paludibacteraceae bacterium]|nr:hypothetical protein [Paludibacteraceae bacterium]
MKNKSFILLLILAFLASVQNVDARSPFHRYRGTYRSSTAGNLMVGFGPSYYFGDSENQAKDLGKTFMQTTKLTTNSLCGNLFIAYELPVYKHLSVRFQLQNHYLRGEGYKDPKWGSRTYKSYNGAPEVFLEYYPAHIVPDYGFYIFGGVGFGVGVINFKNYYGHEGTTLGFSPRAAVGLGYKIFATPAWQFGFEASMRFLFIDEPGWNMDAYPFINENGRYVGSTQRWGDGVADVQFTLTYRFKQGNYGNKIVRY